MISEESIKKFQEIYKKYYKKEISKEEAYESATKLLRLMQIIYKPITREGLNRVKKFLKEIKDAKL